MNKHLNLEDLRDLPVAERLDLIEQLWASLSPDDIDALPTPDWHNAVIDERLDAHRRAPDAARPWEDVEQDILGKLRR